MILKIWCATCLGSGIIDDLDVHGAMCENCQGKGYTELEPEYEAEVNAQYGESKYKEYFVYWVEKKVWTFL